MGGWGGYVYVSLALTHLPHTHTHKHTHTQTTPSMGTASPSPLRAMRLYAHTQTDDLPLYVFDSRFVEKYAGMGEDYLSFLPPYFQQVGMCVCVCVCVCVLFVGGWLCGEEMEVEEESVDTYTHMSALPLA